MSSILIVEDNPDLAFGLRKTLEFEGYEVEVAEDGEVGLEKAARLDPDLIVLDVMLPGMGGYEVLRELRRAGMHVPVLLLTARGEEADIVMGFDSGADDYVTKPFSTLELLARTRALLRRGRNSTEVTEGGEWGFGEIRVDPSARRVLRDGSQISLTPKEFDLLAALWKRQGAVASRSELLEEVWGYANSDVPTRTVDIHIAELRRKIEEDSSEPKYLLTVRKAGYRLETGSENEDAF